MTDHEGLLRAELQWVAAEHEPDRTAMLNRIAANRGAGGRARKQALRLAGVGLAVITALGLGGVASWALAADKAPPSVLPPATGPVVISSTVPAPSASGSPSPSGRPESSRPSRSATSAPPSTAPATDPTPEVRGHPGDTQVEKGSLWSDGSITTAGQSTVTLKASAGLTGLDLTIRVALTAGVTDQGADSADGVTATVEHQSGALLYHFVLTEGTTLPAGTYVFVARYGTASHNASDDTYEAFGTDAGHKRLHVYGNFFAAKD